MVKCCPSFTDWFFHPFKEFFFFLPLFCIAMTPKCSLRHYKRQISFPEAKVLLRHTALRSSVMSLAAQNEHVMWTGFESELVEGCGLRVPRSHRGAVSIQTLQWERNTFRLCEAKRCVRWFRSQTAASSLVQSAQSLSGLCINSLIILFIYCSVNHRFNLRTGFANLDFTVMMITLHICTTVVHGSFQNWGHFISQALHYRQYDKIIHK